MQDSELVQGLFGPGEGIIGLSFIQMLLVKLD